MKEGITLLIKNNSLHSFEFYSSQVDSVKHLRSVTTNIPDVDGLYFVFVEEIDRKSEEHLFFDLFNQQFQLVYFGVAGGTAKTGKIGSQKLRGRINNVVSKSIKRAKYWNEFMQKHNIKKFKVYCCPVIQPQNFEKECYSFLNKNNYRYPSLNKRRGRPPVDGMLELLRK